MIGWYVVGTLAITLLIVVQQGGHYLVARACGMRVLRVRLGFGPLLFRVAPRDGGLWLTLAGGKLTGRLGAHDPARHGDTALEVALLPVSGFTEIAGLSPTEEVDPHDNGSYANASLTARALTLASGPLANYLLAAALFFAAFVGGGQVVDDRRVPVGAGAALVLAVQAPPRVVAELIAGAFEVRAPGREFGGIGKRLAGEATGTWPERLHLLATLSACFGAANLMSLLMAKRAKRKA
jgi:regulator of sigma E protease